MDTLTDEERGQAIERITETLTHLGLLEFAGDVQLLDWSKSTAKDGPKVKFLLTDDDAIFPFEAATTKKGKRAGQLYRLFAVRIDEQHSTGGSITKIEKPFGEQAAELYRVGFFFNRKVLECVGTPDEYREWVQRQPSAYSGDFSEYLESGEGRCVAAHVRRIAHGAGAGIKNDYGEIPLKQNEEHALQHQGGESEMGGKGWFDRQLAKHLSRWVAETAFNKPSMGYVNPAYVFAWAVNNGIAHFLPEAYRG